ncbi:hypothetical protein BGX38DRAFT_251385 [Terfezia claveryi]|nr:hypothetical protein BGX38DRAFT_251385 [Terfezia claveryi]
MLLSDTIIPISTSISGDHCCDHIPNHSQDGLFLKHGEMPNFATYRSARLFALTSSIVFYCRDSHSSSVFTISSSPVTCVCFC